MPHFPVAPAITRLLIKDGFHLPSHRINFLCPSIRKLFRIKRIGQGPSRRSSVISRNVGVRPRRRSSLRERRIPTRLPAVREPNSKSSPCHQNHSSKYKCRLLHLQPSPNYTTKYRTSPQIVSRLSGTGTLLPVLRRPHNQIRAPTTLGSSPDPTSPSTKPHTSLFFLALRLTLNPP